jgi:peptidoglycan/xylan/chitin deacetylase (PgdA/CDA1 family)
MVRLSGVPVLLYHGLTAGSAPPPSPWREGQYWVSAPRFAAHLHAIRGAGRATHLLRNVWHGRGAPRPPGVVLTFDDGRASDHALAWPALLDAGFRAEFFLNTATIGQPGFLAWPQVLEMQRAGMSFQSHGHEHVDLRGLPARELRRQLAESKARLEERLGRPVDFLAAPFGLLDRRVVTAASEAGYRAVCTSRARPARPETGVIDRVAVYRATRAATLGRLVRGHPATYALRSLRALGLGAPRWMRERVRPRHTAAQPAESFR